MDCIVRGVAKSQTRLSDFHFQSVNTQIKIAEQKDMDMSSCKYIRHKST